MKMTRPWKFLAIAAVLCILPFVARGDVVPPGATLVAQSATRNDASTCVNAVGATQQTVTLPACGNGLFQYVTFISSDAWATTAPAASSVTTTTTNLGGLQRAFGLTATGGVSGSAVVQPATPIKAALANTATTIVSNAAITSVTFQLAGCYYCAP